MRLWQREGKTAIHVYEHKAAVRTVIFSQDGRPVSASADQTVTVWKRDSTDDPTKLRVDGTITTLATVPEAIDKDAILVGTGQQTIQLWSITKRERIWAAEAKYGGPIVGLSFQKDPNALLSCSADGALRMWDPATGKEMEDK